MATKQRDIEMSGIAWAGSKDGNGWTLLDIEFMKHDLSNAAGTSTRFLRTSLPIWWSFSKAVRSSR